MDVEVFSLKTLMKSYKLANTPRSREGQLGQLDKILKN